MDLPLEADGKRTAGLPRIHDVKGNRPASVNEIAAATERKNRIAARRWHEAARLRRWH